MRPSAWSRRGFLGPRESLEVVIHEDAQTLGQFGISYEVIADTLENLLNPAYESDDDRAFLEFSVGTSETVPHFGLDNLPNRDMGFTVDAVKIFVVGFMGEQFCPWGCDKNLSLSSIDFLILNRKTGEFFTGPGLIVHLIRSHHFFEGHESPYRVDPTKLIRVLEIHAIE